MKKLILSLLFTTLLAGSSFAVPSLQIFIPGAVYEESTQTWVTEDTDFEVWIVAAKLDHGDIYDVTLVASVLGDETLVDGGLTITPDGGATMTYDAADWTFGTPPTSDPLPSHGIFPTNYVEKLAASVTEQNSANWIPVQDYIAGADGGTSQFGQIFKFNVTTQYDRTHFDAYGFYKDSNGKRVFAPFSHDGESMVPEPTTALLMTLGLGGAALVRRFRNA